MAGSPRGSRRQLLLATLVLSLYAAACGSDPTGVSDRDWQLDFSAYNAGDAQNVGTSCRMVAVLTGETPPIEPTWEATVPMSVTRSAGDVSVSAEGAEAISLQFRLEKLQGAETDDQVRIIVTGAYTATLQGRRTNDGSFRGYWACDEEFFFADDPDLLATGYRPLSEISGFWSLGPLPIF